MEKEKAKLEEGKREAEVYVRVQNECTRAQSRYVQWLSWNTERGAREAIAIVVSELACCFRPLVVQSMSELGFGTSCRRLQRPFFDGPDNQISTRIICPVASHGDV